MTFIFPQNKRPPRRFCIGLWTAFLLLSACAVGPSYHEPATPLPAQWSDGPEGQGPQRNVKWWRDFHDPLLNELIEQGTQDSLSQKLLRRRIEKARADYKLATAILFPTANFSILPPNATAIDLTQLIALTFAFSPDLFGNRTQVRKSASDLLTAAKADTAFGLINLRAEIATTYLELREAQARAHTLELNLANSKKLNAFMQSRYKQGFIRYVDLLHQDAWLDAAQAEIEQNKALVIAVVHKLERLVGKPPGALQKKLMVRKPVPESHRRLHLGVPSELLRRRPDIIAAERRIAASHASIRAAIANLFPQFSIGWILGWQTNTIASNLIAVTNPDSLFFGTVTAPLFDLKNHRNIDLRKREKALALIQYRTTVLDALHEVETQYNQYAHLQVSRKHLKSAFDKKELVLSLLTQRYEKGLSNYEEVIRSEEDLNRAATAYLHENLMYQLSVIRLYTALGGGLPVENKIKWPDGVKCGQCKRPQSNQRKTKQCLAHKK